VALNTIATADIIAANRRAGSHFFDVDTMRFFRSRVADTAYVGQGGIFFVTSERNTMGDYPRLYTVRQFHPAAPQWIEGVSGFQEYRTRSGATARAKLLAGAAVVCGHSANAWVICDACMGVL
jgi:hypothetical protein